VLSTVIIFWAHPVVIHESVDKGGKIRMGGEESGCQGGDWEIGE
jgi:hypothetical protein